MDTNQRLVVQATTWQVSGFGVMLLVGWIITGSASAGGSIAFVGTVLGFIAYFLHELCWSKNSWDRRIG
jgi:uncharacterized membrane protein